MPQKIAVIECCNYVDYPIGGQLTFAKNLLSCFGNQLILFGITTEYEELGKWTIKIIDNTHYDYFPYLYLSKESKKPLIPLRLQNYFALRKYKKEIQTKKIKNVIIQSPDTALAIMNSGFANTCYRFAGTENPLSISRYKFARPFAIFYDKFFLPKLSKINLVLAAADTKAIDELVLRSKGSLKKENIKQFPTKVDTKIFKSLPKLNVREKLNIPTGQLMIVTTGRLGWLKGWKFMIDSFKIFLLEHPDTHMYFIGSGEDYNKIYSYISDIVETSHIHLIGPKPPETIADYLNAADLFIMGSYKEGWSTSLIEAVVCGTPVCVTNFSSAKDIIENGENGYVAENHNEKIFAELMNKSIKIERILLPREIDIEKYSASNLKRDLLKIWQLI
jgi:glycosyltransferase involved in cell wall biosynthesis